jgi:hypothetical protein
MKRKCPPYEIEFGTEGQKPPAYVHTILEDKILIGGALEELGLKNEIAYTQNGSGENNSELIELMLKLNARGAVFSYDPKSMVSPSWFMANLQDKGLLLDSFKEISWRNSKLWLLTTYELA